MKRSGLADSPFFQPPQGKLASSSPPTIVPHAKDAPKNIGRAKIQKVAKARNRDTTVSRHHDTMPSRQHDTTASSISGDEVDIIRKAVKEFGKEAATHRFTKAEKKEIADLIYTYKNRGIKTSENEITRIAVNFIIKDYKENGENSILHIILKVLNG